MPSFEIGTIFGHGTVYNTYYLDIFGLSGALVAHTKLSSEIRHNSGWVVWLD